MMARNTFRKEERLCSKRLIDDLFRNGSSFVLYPFRVVYLIAIPATENVGTPSESQESAKVQILFSAPKRRFKQAVTRNLLKRRMREAYRLQKAAFLRDLRLSKSDFNGEIPFQTPLVNSNLYIAVQYIAADIKEFPYLSTKMREVLGKLQVNYVAYRLGKRN